jgi:hypothetical protein
MLNDEILQKTEEGMKESNKILIQELVNDLEQSGIQPVVAIDGVVKKLKIADESEIRGLENEVKKFGLESSDFCLLKEDDRSYSGVNKIILVYKKSGKIKEYKSSHTLEWVADFHRDLQNKLFS